VLITVTGARDKGYAVNSSSTATRTKTPLLDTPQTIDTLTRQRLDDQALLSITDALRYVPGAVAAQGEGNRDQIVLRGTNTTADFFVDGQRDDVQYFRDFYNLERLEILKGPNAMSFGRGGGGGLINRVTKTPFENAFTGGDISIDTFGAWRAATDINLPLTSTISARVNAFYEDGANHRDVYDLTRWGTNPTLGLILKSGGKITLGYEHFEDHRITDRGIPSQNGRPVTGFRDTFFGDPENNNAGLNLDALTLAIDLPLAPGLTLRHRSRYADYDKFYTNLYPSSAVISGRFNVEAYIDTTARENLLSQTDISYETSAGALDHVLLAGLDIGRQTTENSRLNGFFDAATTVRTASVALDNFTVPAFTLRPGPGQRGNTGTLNVIGVFVQDQISFGPHVELLLGLRYDRFSLDYTNTLTNTGFQRTDTVWSPRLGLVIKPLEAASIYASFSRSFLPQSGDQFVNINLSNAALAPERFQNYEVGAKWDIKPGLTAALALYRLDRTNTRATGPVAGTIVLTGSERSEGLELSLQGAITPAWQVQGGFSVQSAKIRTTTTSAPAGRRVALVPEFQASLWNRYNISENFGLGLGITHQGSSFASISNTILLPAYTRVDTALYLKLAPGLLAQLNIENILNTGYFPTAHTDNNITTGGPRAARLTVRASF